MRWCGESLQTWECWSTTLHPTKQHAHAQKLFAPASYSQLLHICLHSAIINFFINSMCIRIPGPSDIHVCTLPRYSGWSRNHTHIRGLQGLLMVLSVVWLGGWGSGPCHPNPGCAKNGWHGGDDDDDSDPLYGNPCCEKA